jgi:hypothetical protein
MPRQRGNRWSAEVTVRGRYKYVGMFGSKDDAAKAAAQVRDELEREACYQ